MRLKNLISLILLLGLLLSCDSNDSRRPSGITNAGDTPVIALVMKSLANEFFVNMADGAERHQIERADYELIINGIRNESDLAQQVALVDQMISRGVDAIVIAPADSQALVPALARASAAGIVIINIDNRLEPEVLEEYDLSVPFIGPSNQAGAKMVGDFVLAQPNPISLLLFFEALYHQFCSSLSVGCSEIYSLRPKGYRSS